jgi:Ca2+-transporting ATPase
VLLPLHIALLHLVIEPACTIVFEAEPGAPDLMSKPPRPSTERLFGKGMIRGSLVKGLSVSVVVLAVFLISLWRKQGEGDARALTFTTLLIANLGLIQINRTYKWVVAGSVLLLALVFYVPGLRSMFQFSVLHPLDLLICLGAGSLSVAWFRLPNFKII